MRNLLKSSIASYILSLLLSSSLQAAVITTSNGESIEASSISYKEGQVYFYVASETKSLDRRDIKDISFSAKKTQKKEISVSDIGDLGKYIDKAENLIAKYPDAQYIRVLIENSSRHRHDGTNIYRYRCITYVAKEEALWTGHVSLSFDPNREKIKIIHARCLTPEGEVFTLKPDQIKISKGTSGSKYFNSQNNLSFTIPGVTVGSLVDFCYENDEYNPYDSNLFSGRCYFQSNCPIGEKILKVSVPSDNQLYHVAKNLDEKIAAPTVADGVDLLTYTWKMEDIPPLIGEPQMPPSRDVIPALYYSIHKDHKYVHDKLKPMYEKRFELTDDVKAKVDELTQNCKNINEKIAKLYYFCQQDIRYISIKSNFASNQVGHPADETLKNKYGDCTDKGMLLSVMLKHIGVEAYPVLILTNNAGKSIRDIGIFDDNHCITEVHLDGRIFYLDATATDYRYPYFRSDDHEANAMNVMLGTQRTVPLPPPEDNSSLTVRKIKLEPDGTTHIDIETTCNGPTEASYRGYARELKPEEYEKVVRQSISAHTADYVLELATHTNPLDFDTQYKSRSVYTLNRYAPKSGKYMIFSVPNFELRFSEVSLEKRNYAIQHSTSSQRTDQLAVKLPEGYSVKYLPPALRVQSPYVEFEIIYDQQGDEIDITRKLAFPRRNIPVADYKAYKADLEKIAYSSKQKIFLEKISKAETKNSSDVASSSLIIKEKDSATNDKLTKDSNEKVGIIEDKQAEQTNEATSEKAIIKTNSSINVERLDESLIKENKEGAQK